MKKLFLALVAATGMFAAASAQRTEIAVSYGGYTQMDATDCHDDWDHVNNAWGAVTAAVNFNVARNFWIGPSYTFSSTTTKGGPHHSSIAYHAIMLNGRYKYWKNSIVTLYGHLGLGVVVSHMQPRHEDAYNCTYFGVQVAPLGAEVGIGSGFSLYGELGFGAQGLLQVGFKYTI